MTAGARYLQHWVITPLVRWCDIEARCAWVGGCAAQLNREPARQAKLHSCDVREGGGADKSQERSLRLITRSRIDGARERCRRPTATRVFSAAVSGADTSSTRQGTM